MSRLNAVANADGTGTSDGPPDDAGVSSGFDGDLDDGATVAGTLPETEYMLPLRDIAHDAGAAFNLHELPDEANMLRSLGLLEFQQDQGFVPMAQLPLSWSPEPLLPWLTSASNLGTISTVPLLEEVIPAPIVQFLPCPEPLSSISQQPGDLPEDTTPPLCPVTLDTLTGFPGPMETLSVVPTCGSNFDSTLSNVNAAMTARTAIEASHSSMALPKSHLMLEILPGASGVGPHPLDIDHDNFNARLGTGDNMMQSSSFATSRIDPRLTHRLGPPATVGAKRQDISDGSRKASRSSGPRPQDWERVKPILRSLYYEMNMPVPDLVQHMQSHHGFQATVNMYKKQFRNKWKWKKYSRSKNDSHQHGQATSCRRQETIRRDAFSRASSADELLETALRYWNSFVESDFARDPTWKTTSRSDFQVSKVAGFAEYDQGLAYMYHGQKELGAQFLLRGLQELWNTIPEHEANVNAGYYLLLVRYSDRMLYWEQWEIVPQFLFFLTQLSQKIPEAHKLGPMAATLNKVFSLSHGHVIQFVKVGVRVLLDSIQKALVKATDERATGTLTENTDRVDGPQMQGMVGRLLYQEKLEADAGDSLKLQEESLHMQWYLDTYLDDFGERCQRYSDQLLRKAGTSVPFGEWRPNLLDRYVSSLVYSCSYRINGDRGSLDEAAERLLEVVDKVGWVTPNVMSLCNELRQAGGNDLADRLEQRQRVVHMD